MTSKSRQMGSKKKKEEDPVVVEVRTCPLKKHTKPQLSDVCGQRCPNGSKNANYSTELQILHQNATER